MADQAKIMETAKAEVETAMNKAFETVAKGARQRQEEAMLNDLKILNKNESVPQKIHISAVNSQNQSADRGKPCNLPPPTRLHYLQSQKTRLMSYRRVFGILGTLP